MSDRDWGPEEEYAAEPVMRTNGMAIASLVCGILGFATCLCIAFAPAPILAIVFGVVALQQIAKDPRRQLGKGMAIAGIVCGATGILLTAVAVLWFAVAGELQQF